MQEVDVTSKRSSLKFNMVRDAVRAPCGASRPGPSLYNFGFTLPFAMQPCTTRVSARPCLNLLRTLRGFTLPFDLFRDMGHFDITFISGHEVSCLNLLRRFNPSKLISIPNSQFKIPQTA